MNKILHKFYYKIALFFSTPRNLAIWTATALTVPNIVLGVTEDASAIWKVANIALPLGIYLLILSSSKKVGKTTLWTFPFMFFAAFQLVLSYLYGESIIAVDMFLNVVTTNVAEATELLANLLIAIVTVVVLYVPPIVWGIAATTRKMHLTSDFRLKLRHGGFTMTIIGAVLSIIATIAPNDGVFHREIFPVNVVENLVEAVQRTRETARYDETSKDFTYNAISTHHDYEREVYIFVIGETSRAIDWELYGYDRETNPRLKREPNLVFFPKAISESNTTHKSVPMLMSFASAETFDSIAHYKSIITAMKEAGFYTRFYSNQAPNRSYTQFFGNEADDVRYCNFSSKHHPYDTEMLPWVEDAVADAEHTKQFIVLHSYGSHFLYRDRYPQDFATFTPDNAIDANVSHRRDLVNAYDNTIRYTDHFLAETIDILKKANCQSALLYSADHGEDIFDDKRERFLHASPHPTYYQLHVAMLSWVSDSTISRHPDYIPNLKNNAQKFVSPQKTMFNTAMEIAGVTSPKFTPQQSLVNKQYQPCHEPVYLTDLNTPVTLEKSGMKEIDLENTSKVLNAH